MELKEWMGVALQKAEDSLRAGEVPVGCLFIYENDVIASGNNTVNETRNATRHAEINCIDKVLEYCKEKQLDYRDVFKKIDVVVTVEPCIMCAAALHQLHIRRIIYGCPNDRFGGCTSVFEVPKIADATIDITSNVRAEEAMILLKNFYKGTNPNAPECKVKKKKRDMAAQQNSQQNVSENMQQDGNNKVDDNNTVENKETEGDKKNVDEEKECAEVALKNEENIKKNELKEFWEPNEKDEKVKDETACSKDEKASTEEKQDEENKESMG